MANTSNSALSETLFSESSRKVDMKTATKLAHWVLGASLSMFSMLTAAQSVASFTVVNADTNADIATFTSGGTVAIASTPRINLRANASGVGSVVFTDGSSSRTENTAPYSYKGDVNGDYAAWSPAPGSYKITAQPFGGAGGTGAAGASATPRRRGRTA
jgi:hypothetical protein